jgi:hypothetical protein
MSEVVAGYTVHPAASIFPLIEGDEFQELVDSIVSRGVQHPVVVRTTPQGKELIDGRNRVRAVEAARARGETVTLPEVEWVEDGRNVAEWISDTNITRRQMTADQAVTVLAEIYKFIAAENEQRRNAAKFDSEKASKAAKAKHAVRTKSSEPQKRDTKAENARSTVGKVAAKAGVSMHKARQAVALSKAVDAGVVPEQAKADVIAGKKKLKDVLPKRPRKAKQESQSGKRTMAAILSGIRDLIAEWKNSDHNTEVLREELKTQLERL